MSSFGLYLIGFVVLLAGVLVGANLLGVGDQWLMVIALVVLGVGVITGVSKTRRRDAPSSSEPHTDR